jgi:hypothetical protein
MGLEVIGRLNINNGFANGLAICCVCKIASTIGANMTLPKLILTSGCRRLKKRSRVNRVHTIIE